MDIFPSNLGQGRQIALLRQRIPNPYKTRQTEPDPDQRPARIGPLGRWWLGGAGLSPRGDRAGLAALKQSGSSGLSVVYAAFTELASLGIAAGVGHQGHPWEMAGAVILGAGLSALWLTFPRGQMRAAARTPVTDAEVGVLLESAHDALEQSYLHLVRDVLRQPVATETASSIRSALCALGDAIDQLPVGVTYADSDTLRAEAAQIHAEAQGEADAVVAASQERRAETLTRSAEAAERSAVLMRRTAALRSEMTSQIEALRLGLTGLQTASGHVAGLAEMADAVQTVATQALSLADARTELDTAVTAPGPKRVTTEHTPQTLTFGEN